MARPSKQVSNGHPRKQNDLASLSTEVLRLQALSLSITGGKAALISRLKLSDWDKTAPHNLKYASRTCPDE